VLGACYLVLACILKKLLSFLLPNRSTHRRFGLLLVYVGDVYIHRSICGDKDQYTRRSELFVGACYLLYYVWISHCRCSDEDLLRE